MTDAILKKINRHISGGITREADVVYLLVQIRKVLEREKLKKSYPTLILYCDWILHAEIDKNKTRGQILDRVEEVINLLEESNNNQDEIIVKINEAISFVKFHNELKRFFEKNNLTFFTDQNYTAALRLLIEILKDISLLAKDNQFKFSFTSGKEADSFDARIELSDQRVFRSPMTQKSTNWTAGVAMPSGAYEPQDSDS